MAKNLVIVESPAKARTIERFLGNEYIVKASLGHVRDLPKSQIGVEVDNGFTPKYLVPREKKDIVKQIKDAVKKSSAVFLATDPDREGEAISWHLMQATGMDTLPVKRVVFHEITKDAVADAFAHPRSLDMELVNAQQARRILDRLVGYNISPLLWKKVKGGLSAGRVQSVAVRLIVDREREIENFLPVEYWSIDADLAKKSDGKRRTKRASFRASLVGKIGDKGKLEIHSGDQAEALRVDLESATYCVLEVKRRDVPRQPAPPFTTSTMQQEAARKLGFTAKKTMMVAQQLYEGLAIGKEGSVGLITYMRTDSTNIASSAQSEARNFIAGKYGKEFVPSSPRVFGRKAKGAQEAHEAVRPTSVKREPAYLKQFLSTDQFKLYDLVWKRFVASQMEAVIYDSTTVDVKGGDTSSGTDYLLRAKGAVIKFPGFTLVYSEGRDDGDSDEDEKNAFPSLDEKEILDLLKLITEQHFTQPPPRFTEATLVKVLEEKGIGRPSTYAPTLSTIQERGYIEKIEKRFAPTELGRITNDILVANFPNIVDVSFTANMEEELDEIARGERQWVPTIREFYGGFRISVEEATKNVEKIKLKDEPAGEDCEKCGRPMVIKMGRFGRFIACSGFPECRNAKPLLVKTGVKCPLCGGEIVEKRTKKKRIFYGCSNYPNCQFTSWEKPIPTPCPNCGGLVVTQRGKGNKCTNCDWTEESKRSKREVA